MSKEVLEQRTPTPQCCEDNVRLRDFEMEYNSAAMYNQELRDRLSEKERDIKAFVSELSELKAGYDANRQTIRYYQNSCQLYAQSLSEVANIVQADTRMSKATKQKIMRIISRH